MPHGDDSDSHTVKGGTFRLVKQMYMSPFSHLRNHPVFAFPIASSNSFFVHLSQIG